MLQFSPKLRLFGRKVVEDNDFYERFRGKPLVVDKWLTLQGVSALPDPAGCNFRPRLRQSVDSLLE